MNRLRFFLTFFMLFFLPFVILPFGTSHFEVPKVIVAQLLIEFLVVISLFQQQAFHLQKKALYAIVVLVILSIAGMSLFPSKVAFFGNPFRLQGVFLFWHLLLFCVFAKKHLFQNLPAWVVFVFLLAQVSGIFFFAPNTALRTYSFLGEPNAFAAVGAFGLPLLFVNRRKKEIFYLGLACIALIIFSSGSRSGLIAVAVEGVFLLLAKRFPHQLLRVFLICCGSSLLFLVSPFFTSDLHESRVEIWRSASIAFLENPIIGGGVGNVEILLHDASNQFASFISARYVDSSHSIFFDVLLQLGIVGLAAFLALIFLAFRSFFRTKNSAMISLLLGMIVVLSFNPASVWELVVFWYVIGEGVSTSDSSVTIESHTS